MRFAPEHLAAACALTQENPKRGGSANRYDGYKGATTLQMVLDLGGSRGDLANDILKGFIIIEDEGVRDALLGTRNAVELKMDDESAPKRRKKRSEAERLRDDAPPTPLPRHRGEEEEEEEEEWPPELPEGCMEVVALVDFPGDGEGELGFQEGAIILTDAAVFEAAGDNTWAPGMIDDVQGIFPASCAAAGWIATRDENDDEYYYDTETGQTSWVWPPEEFYAEDAMEEDSARDDGPPEKCQACNGRHVRHTCGRGGSGGKQRAPPPRRLGRGEDADASDGDGGGPAPRGAKGKKLLREKAAFAVANSGPLGANAVYYRYDRHTGAEEHELHGAALNEALLLPAWPPLPFGRMTDDEYKTRPPPEPFEEGAFDTVAEDWVLDEDTEREVSLDLALMGKNRAPGENGDAGHEPIKKRKGRRSVDLPCVQEVQGDRGEEEDAVAPSVWDEATDDEQEVVEPAARALEGLRVDEYKLEGTGGNGRVRGHHYGLQLGQRVQYLAGETHVGACIVGEVGQKRWDIELDKGGIVRDVDQRQLKRCQPGQQGYIRNKTFRGPLNITSQLCFLNQLHDSHRANLPVTVKHRCLKCEGCLALPCGACAPCKDDRENGGPGKLRRVCVNRRCVEQGAVKSVRAQPMAPLLLEQLEDYLVNCGGPAGSAEGWAVDIVERSQGATAGGFDAYYFPPGGGKRCRSRAEVARSLHLQVPVKGKKYRS